METVYNTTAAEFEALCKDAAEYFDRLEGLGVPLHENVILHGITHRPEVPDSEMEESKVLEKRIFALGRKVAGHASESALIDEADRKDLREAIKSISAAVRLREYVYRDVYVHHDEDRVLGVSPPSQWEEIIALEPARKAFAFQAHRIRRILELLLDPEAGKATEYLSSRQTTKYRPGTAFIMMRIDPKIPDLEDVKCTIKEVFGRFGIEAVRSDEIEHEGVISQRVLEEIEASEFLIADLTYERPSVYYEVGYAHALKKRVILYRKEGTVLHFDLAPLNCPEYENMSDLRTKLLKRLEVLTNTKPSEVVLRPLG